MKPKLLAISGSSRKNSSNGIIIKYITSRLDSDFVVDVFDSIDQLPHFNPDRDQSDPPAIIEDFRSRIKEAEAILICTPEYVFSLPGTLKNALDWTVSSVVFKGKEMFVIVAAASGLKAMESLQLILTTLEAKVDHTAQLTIPGIRGKINQFGTITDQDTISKLDIMSDQISKSLVQHFLNK